MNELTAKIALAFFDLIALIVILRIAFVKAREQSLDTKMFNPFALDPKTLEKRILFQYGGDAGFAIYCELLKRFIVVQAIGLLIYFVFIA